MDATTTRTGARTCCEHYDHQCNQGRDCPAYRDELRGAAGIVLAVVLGLMVWAAVAAAFIAYSGGAATQGAAVVPVTTSCLKSLT